MIGNEASVVPLSTAASAAPANVVIAPLLVSIVTAVLTLLAYRRRRLVRVVSLLGGVAYVVAVAALFSAVVLPLGSQSRVLVYQVSAWPAPVGISLVADALSAFMLVVAATVGFAALVYAVVYVDDYAQGLTFHPLYHFMLAGSTGAFLTGDLFNLFVWFEVVLMSSYVFVLFYSGPEHTRAALSYVVLNLVGSAVMLLAIGGLYATTGTLNMADLARRLADPTAYGVSILPVVGLAGLLFAVFALKAGVVPFHFWVADAYAAAPAPVAAVLAGVVKKVGVYAIIRLYVTVFSAAALPSSLGVPGLDGTTTLAFFGPVLFLVGTASILFGGFAAAGADDLERLLGYSSIAQVGFIVLPIGVAATAPAIGVGGGATPSILTLGVLASLVYAFSHALAKGLLFLVGGVVSDTYGTTSFDRLGGLASWRPTLAGGAFVGMLALVGIPPLTGFFGKFFVFRVAAQATATNAVGGGLALAVVLVGAVLTVAYYTRAWNAVFWGEPSSTPTVDSRRAFVVELGVVVVLAVLIVGLGVGFEWLYQAAEAAARAAVDTDAYVHGVGPTLTNSSSHAALREVVR